MGLWISSGLNISFVQRESACVNQFATQIVNQCSLDGRVGSPGYPALQQPGGMNGGHRKDADRAREKGRGACARSSPRPDSDGRLRRGDEGAADRVDRHDLCRSAL
ncbi:hypothetical protein SPHINGOAX6_20372 [Sphingomonas sp. AX6]|nr:hypothetical protein SPHINGOAX6_20372 [Sphingomonas sp. AX6]